MLKLHRRGLGFLEVEEQEFEDESKEGRVGRTGDELQGRDPFPRIYKDVEGQGGGTRE